jgi:hypothetical protein
MPTRDPRVDAYIADAPAFAKPILKHIRTAVHAACPDVVETMKWRFPHFTHEGILCSMAAFKEHCAFGFWKGALIDGAKGSGEEKAMGQFGRLRSVSDLPASRALQALVKQAVKLNQEGIPSPTRAARKPRKPLPVPRDLVAALAKNRAARTTFDQFPPSHRREYIEWITEAKREETRKRRLETAVTWMAEGKPYGWKYMK